MGASPKSKPIIRLTLLLFLALCLAGCSGTPSTPQQPSTAAPAQPDHPAVSAQPIPWNSEGTISENEYTQFQQIGSIQVFSRLEGESVCLALRAQNGGYLALGIRPESKMKGADIIICTLKGTQATITDAYATGEFGPHPADTTLGGRDDIESPSGSLQNGWTAFEFKRKLVTGDSRDKDLVLGDNPVIWSLGGSQDITVHHNNRGYATLVLK